jgi:uncharacterized protein (DUF1684 family)
MARFAILFIFLLLFSSCDHSNAPQLVDVGQSEKPSLPSEDGSPPTMEKMIENSRKEKDRILKLSPNSPIPKEERANFPGLNYFPVNLQKYRLDAKLEPYANNEKVKIVTSKGEQDEYIKYGALKFTFDGVDCSLDVFKSTAPDVDAKRLFIPFKDTTSGKETYGAGRYLELEETTNKLYTIDFNLAYNPYCAYNADFSCPIPPAQNTLKVAIKAGEKNYHQ